jgi:hypothetical protein
MPHNLLNVSLFLLKDFKKEPHNLLNVSLFLCKDFKIKELMHSVVWFIFCLIMVCWLTAGL